MMPKKSLKIQLPALRILKSMKTRVVQKAVILSGSGKMLMVRRSNTDVRRPLQWDLPGGLLEENEELISSVAREIKEETGLAVKDLYPIYSKTEIRTWLDGKKEHNDNVVFIFYIAYSVSAEVKLSFEHDKFQWVTLEKAVSQFEYPLHKEVLQHILDNKLI